MIFRSKFYSIIYTFYHCKTQIDLDISRLKWIYMYISRERYIQINRKRERGTDWSRCLHWDRYEQIQIVSEIMPKEKYQSYFPFKNRGWLRRTVHCGIVGTEKLDIYEEQKTERLEKSAMTWPYMWRMPTYLKQLLFLVNWHKSLHVVYKPNCFVVYLQVRLFSVFFFLHIFLVRENLPD